MTSAPLPVDGVLPALKDALGFHCSAILSADPGAGKTTRVPPALLAESWLGMKKIVMLEPRRIAARRAAMYIAQQLGEEPGRTVGYRIRGETVTGPATRIEVVTEGVLTRLLHADPALEDAGLIIFDEFHERSIHADLGLALVLDTRRHLRPDLRVLVMSATLDGNAVSRLLDDAPVIQSEGRKFPVETRYLRQPHEGQVEPLVVSTIQRSLATDEGDLLVFLPGQREIMRVHSRLQEAGLTDGVEVHTLFGEASPAVQRAALNPAPRGRRKVILATSIAETSLTIDGVRVVIDAGLSRVPRFDPRRGMSGLVTTPVSLAAADQRRGRSGRQSPGICYRLWTEQDHARLADFARPEMTVADLLPLALDLARWGTPDGSGLRFLDPPPPSHLDHARSVLRLLGAVDTHGKLTAHGLSMAELPIHPRFAHMLIRGKELGLGALACDLAALLEERDILPRNRDTDIDLFHRWSFLRHGGAGDRGARDRILAQAARLRQMIGVPDRNGPAEKLGVLLALAYPERIARRREADGSRYQMTGGTGAQLPKASGLFREEFLAVADVDGIGNDVKIFLASPVRRDDLEQLFGDVLTNTEEVRWDESGECVVARRSTVLGAMTMSERAFTPTAGQLLQAVLDGVRLIGLQQLPWSKSATALRNRSEWVRLERLGGADWPDLSDERLLETLTDWLAPYLDGVTRRSHIDQLNLTDILTARFSYRQLQDLDRLAPTHLTVPTGSNIPVQYAPGSTPVLAVRLQEMFGQTATPTVGGGKIPVLLHLLSPAHRPLAVTQDLPSFWKNAYPDVRKDMRGRYLKHHWPENPLEATPTRSAKRRK